MSREAAQDAAQAHRCVGMWLILAAASGTVELAAALWIL